MHQPDYSGQFKRDIKQAKRRRKNMEKLRTLMALLINDELLPTTYLCHPLKGNWSGFREVHIAPDWLLIDKVKGDVVRFERTGRHADLFEE